MIKPFPALILALFFLFSVAFSQQRHNSLAIDETIVEEAGPYYFIEYGDSSNAYAKAGPLAAAFGVRLGYDDESKSLTFDGRGVSVRLKATSDVEAGLVKRSGVLTVNGTDVPSPMAIVVDGTSYVAITPIAKAFGAEVAWHGQYRLITINLPNEEPAVTATMAASPEPLPTAPGASDAAAGTALPAFRLGVHDEFTRVAIDGAANLPRSVAVLDDRMVITFAAPAAIPAREERPDGHVELAYYGRDGDRVALIVDTRHRLASDGTGFRMGSTEAGTVYIDFGPGLRGSPVAELAAGWQPTPGSPAAGAGVIQQTVLAPARPVQARPVVVLDAGHGGKFGGTHNGNWYEEEIVLTVTLLAKELLEERGIDVVLTRDRDIHLSDDYRRDLAARAAYATPEYNLFVSIHANAAANRSANGIETFVFGQPLDQSMIERAIRENGQGDNEIGRQLTSEAQQILTETSGRILRETQLNYSNRLAQAVQHSLIAATGAADRGVRQNVFYVLANARTPAILVELGFLSNPEEGARLASNAYQRTLAEALANGILAFLDTGGTLARR